jgi:alpha-ketoglutaric semialdehyde dehydrogenase
MYLNCITNMTITGKNLIGFTASATGGNNFTAVDPSTGTVLPVQFHFISEEEAVAVTEKAAAAFKLYSKKTAEEKALFLDSIAEEIMAAGDALIDRAMQESGLPMARLVGERARTTGQLKMFAKLLREGSWVEARIDTAIPDRNPLPKPDLRSMLVPLGPVMVFGASNFPFAYSAAGGDTASALAAGCPVILKVHPLHPGTDEMIGHAIISAAKKTGMPDGIFSLVFADEAMAIRLVKDPVVKAIGFTGSRKGGMAIFNAAVNRPEPIPVYAEMSAVNPVILMPAAVAANARGIAQGFAASVTMGVGQFCTNPGLVFMVDDANTKIFLQTLAENIGKTSPATMLSKSICLAYNEGVSRLKTAAAVAAQADIVSETGKTTATPYIFSVKQIDFLANKNLANEVFGPVSVVVLCRNVNEIIETLQHSEGQLTATIHAAAADEQYLAEITTLMKEKAGRLVFGGFPTGVEVCDAMVHGGPFPATTDGRSTSVGNPAILRFVRPVAYQNFPQQLLPVELQDGNPRNIFRLVNGSFSKDVI